MSRFTKGACLESKPENEGFNVQKSKGTRWNNPDSEHVTGFRAFCILLLIAHYIAQLLLYGSLARANVQILPKRETVLNIGLEQQAVEGEEVVVSGMVFERTRDAVSSARSVGIEEIRSDPAGIYDIQKIMSIWQDGW